MTRIEQLEKEISLTKELIALRKELYVDTNTNVATTVNVKNTGTGDWFNSRGGFIPTGVPTVYGGNGKVGRFGNTDNWPSSQEMWKGVEKPNYKECSGPCECEPN